MSTMVKLMNEKSEMVEGDYIIDKNNQNEVIFDNVHFGYSPEKTGKIIKMNIGRIHHSQYSVNNI